MNAFLEGSLVQQSLQTTILMTLLMGNKKKYKRYLYKLAKEEGSDIGYLVAQLRYFKNKGVIRDDEARVDTLKPISLSMMVGDILEQYEELGI